MSLKKKFRPQVEKLVRDAVTGMSAGGQTEQASAPAH